MTFRKLFASAGAAALLAGTANAAVSIEFANNDGSANNAIESLKCFATEGSLATSNTANVEFEIDGVTGATGTIFAAGTYTLSATLSGATFSRQVTASDLAEDDGGAGTNFDPSVVVAAGTGAAGSNAVTFTITVATGADDDTDGFDLDLPIQVTEETNVTASFALVDANNASLLNPLTASKKIIRAVDAFAVTVASDALTSDTSINSANPKTLLDGTTTAGTTGTLGTVTLSLSENRDPLCVTDDDGTLNVYPTIASMASGTPLNPDTASVIKVSLTASSDGTLGELATVNGAKPGVEFDVDFNGNSIVTVGTAKYLQENITLSLPAITSTKAIDLEVQTVSVEGDVDLQAGLSDEDIPAVALDKLQLSGQEVGSGGSTEPFQWVGDSSKSRLNVFRCTGGGLASTTDIQVTMTNSSSGLSNATKSLGKLPAAADAQFVFNSDDLTDAHGDFGIADFLLNFVGASKSVACDRLMSSPANGIVTTYNGDN